MGSTTSRNVFQTDDGRVTEIFRASDTTYYITGAWVYDRNSTGSTLWSESYIVKLDKNFDEVYQLRYGNQEYFKSYIMAAIETADSNIVLASSRQDFDTQAGTGKLVNTKPASISTSSMSASITIDVSQLESGIYIVKVGRKTQKLGKKLRNKLWNKQLAISFPQKRKPVL